jgi:hypothetical protein
MSWIKIWKGVCRYLGEHKIHSLMMKAGCTCGFCVCVYFPEPSSMQTLLIVRGSTAQPKLVESTKSVFDLSTLRADHGLVLFISLFLKHLSTWLGSLVLTTNTQNILSEGNSLSVSIPPLTDGTTTRSFLSWSRQRLLREWKGTSLPH